MARKRKTALQLYGTKQVAEILGIPEWRVKNFTQGDAYKLPLPQTVGSGRGSRRLYNEDDVLRLAIANELVNCGFTPEAVGEAVREIPESKLKNSYAFGLAHDEDDPRNFSYVLVRTGNNWEVKTLGEVMVDLEQGDFLYHHADRGFFLLHLDNLLEGVLKKMNKMSQPEAKEQQEAKGGR